MYNVDIIVYNNPVKLELCSSFIKKLQSFDPKILSY